MAQSVYMSSSMTKRKIYRNDALKFLIHYFTWNKPHASKMDENQDNCIYYYL